MIFHLGEQDLIFFYANVKSFWEEAEKIGSWFLEPSVSMHYWVSKSWVADPEPDLDLEEEGDGDGDGDGDLGLGSQRFKRPPFLGGLYILDEWIPCVAFSILNLVYRLFFLLCFQSLNILGDVNRPTGARL